MYIAQIGESTYLYVGDHRRIRATVVIGEIAISALSYGGYVIWTLSGVCVCEAPYITSNQESTTLHKSNTLPSWAREYLDALE